MIGDLSYTSYGFNWNDGKNLEETMTRFSNLQSSRVARKSNDGREKASTDRLSIERLDQSGVVAGLAACPMLTRSFMFIYKSCSNFYSGNTVPSSSNKHSSVPIAPIVSNKPFMKVLDQGSAMDNKLQNLRDKLAAIKVETEHLRAAQAAQQLTSLTSSSSSSGATSSAPHTSAANGGSGSAAAVPVQATKLGLEVAVRWRNLTRELLKLPESVLATAAAFETLSLCLYVLVCNDHFYSCNLGEMDVNWSSFVEIQSVRPVILILRNSHFLSLTNYTFTLLSRL